MKILIAEDGQYSNTHGTAFGNAFKSFGHDVSYFKWGCFFKNYPYEKTQNRFLDKLQSIYYRFQNKYKFGPSFECLNKNLYKNCVETKPDLLFILRGTHVKPSTIKKVKSLGVTVFGYNNDDPFSEKYPAYFWRFFIKSIPHYNHVFYYRPKNKADFEKIGKSEASLLRSYYIEEENFSYANQGMPLPHQNFNADVSFIGHFEDDGRDDVFRYLLENNVPLQIYGPLWKNSKHYSYFKEKLGRDISSVYGSEYNIALNSAKISIVVLSKLNNDTYTRRCFEIPATGSLMLSEKTEDLLSLFKENEEAVYFETKEELLSKVQFLLKNEQLRKKIAKAGYFRVLKDGHEVEDRAKEVLSMYERYKNA